MQHKYTLPHNVQCKSVDFYANNDFILIAGYSDGTLTIWKIDEQKKHLEVQLGKTIEEVKVINDWQILVRTDTSILIVNTATLEVNNEFS